MPSNGTHGSTSSRSRSFPSPPTAPDPVQHDRGGRLHIAGFETVISLIDDCRPPARRSSRALSAGLRYGCRPMSGRAPARDRPRRGDNVAKLAAELPEPSHGAIRQTTEVILDELAGKEVLDRLLPVRSSCACATISPSAWPRSVPADPDAWLTRAQRWPDRTAPTRRSPRSYLGINIDALPPDAVREKAIEQYVDAVRSTKFSRPRRTGAGVLLLLTRSGPLPRATAGPLFFHEEAMADTAAYR